MVSDKMNTSGPKIGTKNFFWEMKLPVLVRSHCFLYVQKKLMSKRWKNEIGDKNDLETDPKPDRQNRWQLIPPEPAPILIELDFWVYNHQHQLDIIDL